MKVACPECGFASQVDPSRIPAGGARIRCRKCNASFELTPPEPAAPREKAAPGKTAEKKAAPAQKAPVQKAPVQKAPVQKAPAQKAPAQKAPAQKVPAQKAAAQKVPAQKAPAPDDAADMFTCEKCRHRQHPGPRCVYCGTPFPEYRPPEGADAGQGGAADAAGSIGAGGAAGSPKPAAAAPVRPAPPLITESAGGPSGRRCPFCDEMIREDARKCRYCHEFLDSDGMSPPTGEAGVKAIMPGIVDFAFRKMITPALARALYAAAIVIGALAALGGIYFSIRGGGYLRALAWLGGYLLYALAVRLHAECVLVLFKIAENTRRS